MEAELIKALNRMAAAMEALAEAIAMRTRYEAGEDDDASSGFSSLGDR